MQKYILQSGKQVELNLPNVDTAVRLYQVLVYTCKNCNLDLSIANEETIASLFLKNTESILSVLSSETVLECIKECCTKILYNKQKFSMDLFEDVKNRQDFFPLMQLVAVETLRPFFPSLDIVFNAIMLRILQK